MLTNEGQRVRKGGQGFGIPGRRTHDSGFRLQQGLRHHCHQRIQPKQRGRGAGERLIIPLPPGSPPSPSGARTIPNICAGACWGS